MTACYIQDTREIEVRKPGTPLWHAVDHLAPHDPAAGTWYVTKCGMDFIGEFPSIDEAMTLRSWDAMYGDDVDLCTCAVTDPDDRREVLGVVEGNAPVAG